MNVIRGSEYVRQGTMEFQLTFGSIWASPITVGCEVVMGIKDILIRIPSAVATMTSSGVLTAQLPNAFLYPKNLVSFAINAVDGSINAYFVPGKMDISTSGLITIRPSGAAVYSGEFMGGFDGISVNYESNGQQG